MNRYNGLNHLSQQVIDLVLSATKVTAINIMVVLLSETSLWIVELEVPQESVGSSEIWAYSVNLVYQIFHAHDS